MSLKCGNSLSLYNIEIAINHKYSLNLKFKKKKVSKSEFKFEKEDLEMIQKMHHLN